MSWLDRWKRKEQPLCRACGRPLTLSMLPLVHGVHGQVEVIFRGLPILACPNQEHPKRYARTDFGVYTIDAVFWQGRVPLGKPGRLAKVKCYRCGKNIHKEPQRPSEVAGLLNIADLPEFGIRIKGPVVTCPRCNSDQLWASQEIGRDVSSAMVQAFEEAGLER